MFDKDPFEDMALASRVQSLYTFLENQDDLRIEEIRQVARDAQKHYHQDCKDGKKHFNIFENEAIPARAVLSHVEAKYPEMYGHMQRAQKFWDEAQTSADS